jgi:DNA polymerase-3 subunit epsilon
MDDAEVGQLADVLQLQRPLVWLDTETTGTAVERDRVVQLGLLKIEPDGTISVRRKTLVNPTVPIPPEATAVHGITDADVKDAPTFAQLAKSLAGHLHMVDLAGFNVRFDIDILDAEFTRCTVPWTAQGRIVDASAIYRRYHRRRLVDAVREYLGEERAKLFEEGAHDALVDTEASLEVFVAQLARHAELPRTVEDLYHDFFERPQSDSDVDADGKFTWRFGEAHVNFGQKHPGKRLRDVAVQDRSFLEWMLRARFLPATKKVVRDALEGVFPKKEST